MRMTNRNIKISPFRYWCQQTLPLTFDDSLSYMELLSKVIKHLNDCVADVATAEQDIINLHNAFVQLQSYVNDYFQNLDVQTEVDHKIDEMVENGTFDELLDPIVGSQIAGVVADQIGDVVAAQIGDVVAGQIGDVVEEQLPVVVNQQLETVVGEQVTEWLEENVDPTTMPVVDPTLSIRGAAADAKETGDRFRSIGVYHPNVIDANLFSVPYSYDDTWDQSDIIPTHLNTFQVSESGWYAVVARFKWGANMTVNDWNVMPALYRASDNTRLNISGAVPALNSKSVMGENYATIVGVWHAVAFLDEDLKLGFHFYNGSTAIYLDFEVSDYALIKFDSSDELYEWADNNCPNVDGYYTPVSNGVFVVTADVESPNLIAKFAELEEKNTELRQELIDSYVTDSATGAIASFSDGADGMPVKDLKVAIEPVQNLNGYDNPWPAGGGRNFLPPMVDGTYEGNGAKIVVKDGIATLSGTTTATANISIPLSETITCPASFYYHCMNSVANSNLAPSIENSQNTAQNVTYGLSPANRITGAITTAQGQTYNRIRFYIGSGVTLSGTYSPMFCLDNTATAYAPYSNICPISGWTGAKVYRTGKNLLNSLEVINAYLAADNNLVANANNRTAIIPCVPNTTYTWSWNRSAITGADDSAILGFATHPSTGMNGNRLLINSTSSTPRTFTTSATDRWLAIKIGNVNNTNVDATLSSSQLELGSTATDYEPYNGNTYPITWQTEAGTVYGGTLDVTTGVLTVNKASVDLGTLSWNNASAVGAVRATTCPDGIKSISGNNIKANLICSNYKVLPYYVNGQAGVDANSTPYSIAQTALSDANTLFVRDPALANKTGEQVKTALTGVQLVYELSTPLTYQLTPIEVSTVLGQNNIWANCGDVDVEYRADTKLYIQKVIA